MYVCMYECMYVCMYECMHVCMNACMYVRTYVRMYVCMYVCMYVVHLHLQSFRFQFETVHDNIIPPHTMCATSRHHFMVSYMFSSKQMPNCDLYFTRSPHRRQIYLA